MDLFAGTLIYFIIWMVIYFMTLPLGFHLPKYIKPGWATSAPEKPKIIVKVVLTTLLSFVVWLGIHLLFKKYPHLIQHYLIQR